MAKVLNPLMSNEARGKMNGLVYNTWRGTSTVKTFKSPTQPQSQAQLITRNMMTLISKKWAGLTDAQRAAWTAWADAHLRTDWTGNTVRMTGANAFISLNCNAWRAGNSFTGVNTPPATIAPEAADFGLSVAAGALKVTSTTMTLTDYKKEVRFLQNDSPGRNRRLNEMKTTAVYTGSNTEYTACSDFTSGNATAFCRVIRKTDGQVSPWVKLTIASA